MSEIKDVVQNLKSAAKRRRVLLILTPILFLLAAIGAIYVIQPKYQSSTSILVMKDETLNPLVLYEMAVNIASEDRLLSFNEIIYSRTTMEKLIDSLELDRELKTEYEKQRLIETLRRNISTSSRASDSFEISYFDTDPVRARDGAALLASHFINTRLKLESRRHDETVTFFQNKLNELEVIVGQQREEVVNVTEDRLKALPSDETSLQARLQTIDTQLDQLEWEIFQEEQKLASINSFQNEPEFDEALTYLYQLPLEELAFGAEMVPLLNEYSTLREQFTASYPRLKTIASSIRQQADRIPPVYTVKLERLNNQKDDLSTQKSQVVTNLQRSFVATQRASSQLSDFSIYEGLQNEMKVKLEQAKMTRDIGKKGAEQFMVLDAPYVPEKPVSPQKKLIIGIGLFIGFLVGAAASTVAEILDTTIRDESDLPFDKPIIAYITAG